MKRSLLSGILITTMLLSACNYSVSTSGQTDNSVKGTTESTLTESTSETIEPTENYSFTWTDKENVDFDEILEKKFNIGLSSYIIYFGFTDELRSEYTDFVNKRFGTNYDSVSFAKSNYFFAHFARGGMSRDQFQNYEDFKMIAFNAANAKNGALNNKLIMSYLVQNKIPLGQRVSIDELRGILGGNVYTVHPYNDVVIKARDVGNYDSSYQYSNTQLYGVLGVYDAFITKLCADVRIKDFCLYGGRPEFDEIRNEVIPIYNSHLKKFYGDNAPQFGEIVTADQYRAMFGEDPLDLSYIPGAVVNQKTS